MPERSDKEQKEQVEGEPVPPDAPIETPEADPRTENAPDKEVRSVPDERDETEEQIRKAFE